MPMIDAFIAEFEHEAKTTRKLLERVPEDRLDYQPHEKSMTLGRLSGHVAEIPFWAHATLAQDVLDFSQGNYTPCVAESREQLLAHFDQALGVFRQATAGYPDAKLADTWSMRRGDQVLFQAPRAVVLRSFVMSHCYHHRGQLSVYLRLLDVPLPPMYGPTADENPWS